MHIKETISRLIESLGEGPYYRGQDIDGMLNLLELDYLSKTGYLESITRKLPIRNGLPIPWITYSALEFLEANIASNAKVLEFGAGFSSFFWALRGNNISYLEFNKEWNQRVSNTLLELNLESPIDFFSITADLDAKQSVVFREFTQRLELEESFLSTNFSDSLNAYILEKIESANLVIIDGQFRNYFLEMCSKARSRRVVVLDNSERIEYRVGKQLLLDAGYSSIDFTGLGPVNPYGWTTSIFIQSFIDLKFDA